MILNERIVNRVKAEVEYALAKQATVREVARHFKASKSTVYVDLTARIKEIDREQYLACQELLQVNKSLRAIHGGLATKKHWEAVKCK